MLQTCVCGRILECRHQAGVEAEKNKDNNELESMQQNEWFQYDLMISLGTYVKSMLSSLPVINPFTPRVSYRVM